MSALLYAIDAAHLEVWLGLCTIVAFLGVALAHWRTAPPQPRDPRGPRT